MKLAYKYIAIFFNFSTTLNHLHLLQVDAVQMLYKCFVFTGIVPTDELRHIIDHSSMSHSIWEGCGALVEHHTPTG